MTYRSKPSTVDAWQITDVIPVPGGAKLEFSDRRVIQIQGNIAPSPGDYVVNDYGGMKISPKAFFDEHYEAVGFENKAEPEPFDWDALQALRSIPAPNENV